MSLPDELLLKIFEHLSFKTKTLVLPLVCWRWRRIAMDASLFRCQLQLEIQEESVRNRETDHVSDVVRVSLDKLDKFADFLISLGVCQPNELEIITNRYKYHPDLDDKLVDFLNKTSDENIWKSVKRFVLRKRVEIDCAEQLPINAIERLPINEDLVELHLNLCKIDKRFCYILHKIQRLKMLRIVKLISDYISMDVLKCLSESAGYFPELREIHLRCDKSFLPQNGIPDTHYRLFHFLLPFQARIEKLTLIFGGKLSLNEKDCTSLEMYHKLKYLTVWNSRFHDNFFASLKNLIQLEELFLAQTDWNVRINRIDFLPPNIQHLQLDMNIQDGDVKIVCEILGKQLKTFSIYADFIKSDSFLITESVMSHIIANCSELIALRLKMKLEAGYHADPQSMANQLQSMARDLQLNCVQLQALFLCIYRRSEDGFQYACHCSLNRCEPFVFEYGAFLEERIVDYMREKRKPKYGGLRDTNSYRRFEEYKNSKINDHCGKIHDFNKYAESVLRCLTSCSNMNHVIDMYRICRSSLCSCNISPAIKSEVYDDGFYVVF